MCSTCAASRFFRPFLICFDQTETYGTSPDLARSLGAVVMDLVDEACQLTVITANLDPWEKLLSPNWQDANLDRLAQPYLMLEGITQQQGRELAEHRLESLEVDRASRDRFWGDGRWLEELFEKSKEMSVRDFLHECSHRWAAELTVTRAEPPPSNWRISGARSWNGRGLGDRSRHPPRGMSGPNRRSLCARENARRSRGRAVRRPTRSRSESSK